MLLKMELGDHSIRALNSTAAAPSDKTAEKEFATN
jgi:hypothetical protein